jgi:hypothetical protein
MLEEEKNCRERKYGTRNMLEGGGGVQIEECEKDEEFL